MCNNKPFRFLVTLDATSNIPCLFFFRLGLLRVK